MKAKIPTNWLKSGEYSFRFHSCNGCWQNAKKKERWYIDEKNGMAWTCGDGDINLDIFDILKQANNHGMLFDILLSHCISHEMIHNILKRKHDYKTYRQFDNICSDKNLNFETWFGGMA